MISTRERDQAQASASSPEKRLHPARAAAHADPRAVVAAPRLARPADVLALQRTVGNRAVGDLLPPRAPAANGVVQRGKRKRDEKDDPNWKGKGPAEEESEEENLSEDERPPLRARYERGAKPAPDFQFGSDGGKRSWVPARLPTIDYGEYPLGLAIRAVNKDPRYRGLLLAHRRAGMSEKLTERIWAFFRKHRPAHYAALLKVPGALLSRNHRLADSVIGMLVTVAHYNFTLPANADRRDEMMEAFVDFARAVAGDEVEPALENFRAAIGLSLSDMSNRSEILRLLGRVSETLSMSATNVRPGWAHTNREILNSFDAGYDAKGRMTPFSEGIEAAVHGLAAAGVVSPELAAQAVRQAVDQATGEKLSSTVRSEEDSEAAGPAPPAVSDDMEDAQELAAAAATFTPVPDPSDADMDDDMYD
jgi:hypothetical protein